MDNKPFPLNTENCEIIYIFNAGLGSGFSEERGRRHKISPRFPQKLHEMEKILVRREGGPPMQYYLNFISKP